jgi:hypothetical protein
MQTIKLVRIADIACMLSFHAVCRPFLNTAGAYYSSYCMSS